MAADSLVVAITGSAGVLGAAVAARFAAAGHRVAAIDQAPAIAGEHALALPNIDLTDPAAAQAAFRAIGERFGRLDGLANIAGGFRWETLEAGDIATWDRLYNLNVRTAAIASKAALPLLIAQGGGAIVNVSAAGSFKAGAGMGAYAASKSGVSRLTESLAEELKDRGVRVNAVLPSIIDTPANRADMPKADFSRWVAPAALAEVIAFLISSRSAAVTGALLPVTGRV